MKFAAAQSLRFPAAQSLKFTATGSRWSLALCLVLRCIHSDAQPQYSRSPEYQKMIEELHAPAPSPAYIATGERPHRDASLQVQVREDRVSIRWSTRFTEYTFDKAATTLTMVNLRTRARWILSRPAQSLLCATAPAAPPGRTQNIRHQKGNQNNQWTLSSGGSCGRTTMTLELLTDSLARLTCNGVENSTAPDLQLHLEGGSPLFGLGERFWQAGLAGTHLDVRPSDSYGEPSHNWVYVAIPLVYSAGGLGLYADTAFDTNFRFNAAGSAFDLKVANHPVPLYLISMPGPKEVLSSYTALTGRPPLPPLWTFGPWLVALHGKDEVLERADQIRKEGIPASALWVYDQLDEPNNLGWPFWFSSSYGDPRAFTNALHAKGYKVLTYVHPYLRERLVPYQTISPAYEKGVREGLLMTGADGLPFGPGEQTRTGNLDFTHPLAVDWWQKMLTSAVRDQGFDGWMEDFGEWVRDTDRFAAGNGAILSELYPLLYHKITLRIVQALNPDVVAFSRSGSPGSQQFSPVLWGADQTPDWSRDWGLPSVVTAGITAGMSGFSTWGPDILSDGDSKELWTRWVEFGALTPVMRDHVWQQPEHSINLWSDAETKALFRRYAILHSSLLPYFTTYAAEAHRTGVPILRHTVLQYPDDPRSSTAEYQYLLGEDLLVAPVIKQGATTRTLYLPRGDWVNYWTGEHYAGAQEITLAAPLDQIPLLVRAGSILPFKPESETAAFNWSDPRLLSGSLVWKIYTAAGTTAERNFTLPDGTSAHLHQRGGTVQVEGSAPSLRTYEIVMRTVAAPQSLRLNGQPLELVAQPMPGSPVSGWWFDPATREVHAAFQASAFNLEIVNPTALSIPNSTAPSIPQPIRPHAQ